MIKVLFSPGCYGTYLSWCLYNYTNLRLEDYTDLDIDQSGSSHVFRKNKLARQVIWAGHPTAFEHLPTDRIIILQPHQQHRLDYYNNQYHKNENLELINYLLTQLPIDDINNKLKTHWGCTEPLSLDIPRWILREFFSFWINDCLANGYSINQYKQLPSNISLTTQDMFDNFYDTLKKICQACNLMIDIDVASINKNHNTFLNAQLYHNGQLNCEKWVLDTIAEKESTYTPKTIFEEAYIQHIFRTQGYEIKCDGLDRFPIHTSEMIKLIYANSNNYN